MKITPQTHPELWAINPSLSKNGVEIDNEKYMQYRKEANLIYQHLSHREKEIVAMHIALTHQGFHGQATAPEKVSPKESVARYFWFYIVIIVLFVILLLLVAVKGHAEPLPEWNVVPINANIAALRSFFPQIVVNPGGKFDASGNFEVNCVTGCSASSGFSDNSSFTVGTSTINVIGGYYTTGAAPSLSSGNAARARIDASSYLFVDCAVGCSASAGFSDNSGFTAGTTPISITGGWYSTSPTNCTTGNGCAPQLTVDRKLFVQDFQGTSPWVVSLASTTITGSVTVTGTFWPYSLGQQLAANSVPVILPSATITTLTPPTAAAIAAAIVANPPTVPVTGTFWQTTQPVSGTFWQTTQPVSWSGQTVTATQATGSNLHMVCDSGCSSSAGFADNSAFTVGTTAINPIGGLYDAGADPAISNGNAGRARIDAHSYLYADIGSILGTAPTTAGFLDIKGADGNVFVRNAIAANFLATVTQGTSPWVDNLTQWGSTTLGTPTNFGTTPGAVIAASVNASLFSGTTALGTPNTFGTTAPTGNALGVNASLFVGTTLNPGSNGTSSAGDPRVNIASDNTAIANWGQGATGSAVPTGAGYVGGNGSGNLTGLITCDNNAAINMSTATTTQIIAISGTGGRTYICAIDLVNNAADNVALISGSGTNCASNLAGLAGGTTAATGWNFAANGGLTKGTGIGMLWKTVTTNNEVCLVTSAATQLSGSITYTQF